MKKVGRYEILKELGRGGQSIAYLAKDPVIGRLTAIKLMHPLVGYSPSQKKEYWERFLREAQAAGRLMHGNIAVIYDVGESEGSPFIAMEYIEGETLAAILKTQYPLHYRRIIALIRQVLNGLQYAHEHGIIHRDIKPGNIMVNPKDVVKLVDFGIAKVDSTQVTAPGNVLGTPSYMSPEQITGEKVDRRADLFSVGVVLYQCLAGRLPFTGDHATTVIYRIVHEPYPMLNYQALDLPSGMDDVLQKALSKKKENRFSSCQEMEKSLELLLQQDSVQTEGSQEACNTVALDCSPSSAVNSIKKGHSFPSPADKIDSGIHEGSGQNQISKEEACEKSEVRVQYPFQGYRWIGVGMLLVAAVIIIALYTTIGREQDSSNPFPSLPTSTASTPDAMDLPSTTQSTPTSTIESLPTTSLFPQSGGKEGVPASRSESSRNRTNSTFNPSTTYPELGETSTSTSAPPVTSTLTVVSETPQETSSRSQDVVRAAWKIPVTHNHLMGGCRGNLIITEESLEFYPEKGNHNLKVLVSEIERLNWRESPNKFRISLSLKTGKEANYESEGTENKGQMKQAYDALRRSYTTPKP